MGLFKRNKNETDVGFGSKEWKKWYKKGLKLVSPLPVPVSIDEKIVFKRPIESTEEKIKKDEEAIECFNKALELYYDSHSSITKNKILSLKLILVYLLKRYNEAIECADKIIFSELNDNSMLQEAYGTKILSLIFCGKATEAIILCDKSLERITKYNCFDLTSEKKEFFTARNLFYKAKALYVLERYEESLEYCERSLNISNGEGPGWKYKIYSLDKLGRHKEALQCLDDFARTKTGALHNLEDMRKIIENEINSAGEGI